MISLCWGSNLLVGLTSKSWVATGGGVFWGVGVFEGVGYWAVRGQQRVVDGTESCLLGSYESAVHSR